MMAVAFEIAPALWRRLALWCRLGPESYNSNMPMPQLAQPKTLPFALPVVEEEVIVTSQDAYLGV